MTRLLVPVLVLAFLSGCASSSPVTPMSSAEPTATRQAECEQTGGQWRTGMCEKTQGGGGY